jgi:hypothetical protein
MTDEEPISPILSIIIPLAIGIFISAITVGPLYFFWGSSYKQVNREGVIKILATYIPPQQKGKDNTKFHLLIETHSDEFEIYDVRGISFLRVDGGPLQGATKWVPSGKGHHLNGTIEFAQVIPRGTHNLQLVIKNLDGRSNRVLEWKVNARS